MNKNLKEDVEVGFIVIICVIGMLIGAHYMNKKECARSGGEYAALQCTHDK